MVKKKQKKYLACKWNNCTFIDFEHYFIHCVTEFIIVFQ